eukprot:TRINITY_DN11539_c0_g1_i4.p1 TRINITY_DN11539_c0_g1~~TRINITY_DN11539_c0_g1_i4.p1  ORF type:complete len:836 (+),score=140.50 TRINITY_DN11539_c0_g1_i4:114-2510(+)
MVVLAAIELAAKEVFDYNREAFTYDEEQRLKRDICLLSLQVERFDLFREDIEDLVKLTVDKMDMYHLVGALFLSFTATMFTEGRIHGGVVPPFFAGIYLLSIASSFVYLLLAVWLSMHASISSHGYGVRLRCRFIRLPIPTSKQLARVSTTLAEFEQCGLRNTMRIPFGPDPAQHWNNDVAEELSVGTNGDVVGRHVQLFRKLQAKWQCFDAYARVCMAFGVNQIVESICYYLIGVTLIQRCAPATCAALLVVFQATAVVLSALDIVSLKQWQVIALQAFGSTPVWVTFVALVCGKRDSTKVLKTSNAYYLPVVAFLTKALWLQLLLWLAEPSEDEAALPRSFRAVLFLDVFGDVACDPTNEEASLTTQGFNAAFEEQAAVAERALNIAHTALRRWEAVPVDEMSHSHGSELRRLREDILVWRRLLSTSLKRYYTSRGMCGEVDSLEDTRSWGSLTLAEQLEDNFPGFLVGPLAGDCFYNLEAGEVIRTNVNFETLRLDEVAAFVGRAEGAVRLALATCGENGEDGADDGHEVSEDAEGIVSDNSEDRRTTDISGSSSQVDQLPWKLVRRMTHLMQFVHVLLAVAEALELFGYVDMDHVLPEDVGRRLGFGRESDASLVFSDDGAVAAGWTHFNLSRVQVAWPFGDWFQPASLACLPVPPFASPLGIIVGSPALLYWAEARVAFGFAPGILSARRDSSLRVSIGVASGGRCREKSERDQFRRPLLVGCTRRGESCVVVVWKKPSRRLFATGRRHSTCTRAETMAAARRSHHSVHRRCGSSAFRGSCRLVVPRPRWLGR